MSLNYEPHPLIVAERKIIREGGWKALQEHYNQLIRDHPKWCTAIGIPCAGGEMNVHSFAGLMNAHMPPSLLSVSVTTFVHLARNEIVTHLLEEPEWSHLLWVDDDTSIPRFAVMRMLQYDIPLVTGLVCFKSLPIKWMLYEKGVIAEKTGERKLLSIASTDRPMAFHPQFRDRLLDVESAGLGILLCKREVFEKMEPPWFSDYDIEKGIFIGEDMYFFEKAKKAGYPLKADTSIICEHYVENTSFPGLLFEKGRFQCTP